MPHNGEKNLRFGVYKSLCCGEDIILPEGKAFPDCPNHPNLPTIWKPAVGEKFLRLTQRQGASPKPRFNVGDRVQVVGLDPHRGKLAVITQIVENPNDLIYRYEVRFSDETTARFFGFQLRLFQAESSRSA